MAQKAISKTKLSDTLSVAECKDGFWLYDETRGMHVAVRAKTERDAFIEALSYYQKRLSLTESRTKVLQQGIDNFIETIKH